MITKYTITNNFVLLLLIVLGIGVTLIGFRKNDNPLERMNWIIYPTFNFFLEADSVHRPFMSTGDRIHESWIGKSYWSSKNEKIDGFGMGSSAHLRVGADQLEAALDELKSMNVHWVREEIPWAEIEPSPDSFRWDYSFGETPRDFSLLVSELEKRDIEIVALLDYGPIYGNKPIPEDKLLIRWENYVQAVVIKFGDQIDHWEIQNEMNSPLFWGKVIYTGQSIDAPPDPELYTKMLDLAYTVIKKHSPDDEVVLGGLVGNVNDNCETNPFDYLHKVHQAGGWSSFDVIAIHPYWEANPPEAFINRGRGHSSDSGACQWDQTANYNMIGEARAIRDLVNQFGSKPIWVTEVGWSQGWLETLAGYRGTDPDFAEADYLTRTYIPLLSEPGVNKVFWYTQYDDPGIWDQFALDSPGQQAFQNLSFLLTGSTSLGQSQGQGDQGLPGDDDVYEYRFEKEGQLIIVIWKSRGGDVPRDVTISDVDVDEMRLYNHDADDFSPDAGREIIVEDGKLTVKLTERPVILISSELNLLERLQSDAQRRVDEWVQDQTEKISRQIDEWWQRQREELERRLTEWLLSQWENFIQQLEDAINRWLEEQCASVGFVLLLPLFVLIVRRKQKKSV